MFLLEVKTSIDDLCFYFKKMRKMEDGGAHRWVLGSMKWKVVRDTENLPAEKFVLKNSNEIDES